MKRRAYGEASGGGMCREGRDGYSGAEESTNETSGVMKAYINVGEMKAPIISKRYPDMKEAERKLIWK